MKKIKTIYKLLLVLPLIALVSCDTNDDIQDVVTNTTTTTENSVFIETDDAAEVVRVVGTNDPQPIVVGVNNTLDTDTTVSFSVFKNGVPALAGVDYNLNDATILATESTGGTLVTFLNEGDFEVMVVSSSNSSLVVVENRALFLVPAPVSITVTLDWADAAFDLDIELDRMTEDWNYIDTLIGSYGLTNSETFTISIIDGNYAIWINEFAFTADVDYTMTVTTVNGTETFTGTVTQDSWRLWFTFGRDSNNDPEFTFYEVDPS